MNDTLQYLDVYGLQAYDALIKAWVNGTGDGAKSDVVFRTVRYDSDNIYFYHKNGATSSDTADVTVPLTGSDVTKALAEISAIVTALGGSMSSTSPYTVTFPSLTTTAKNSLVAAINELDSDITVLNGDDATTGSVAKKIKDAIATLDADLDASGTAAHSGTFVVSGITEVDGVITSVDSVEVENAGAAASALATAKGYTDAEIAKLDVSEFALASESNNVVTIKGIKEVDGKIEVGTDTTKDITLGTAAKANKATTAITEGSTDSSLVSASQVATFVAAEIAGLEGAMHFVGVIERQEGETDAQAIARVVTTPKAGDVVVMSDNAKEYIYVNATAGWREVGDETEFVKKSTQLAGVAIQNGISKADMLTALNVADGAQVNVLEGVQVNGTDLSISNKKVNVTVAEGSTDGTIAVNSTDVAVHGLGSAAYTSSSDYDAAGTASSLIGDLDTTEDIVLCTSDQTGNVISVAFKTTVNEVDGVINTTGSDTVTIESIPDSDIESLFANS